MCRPCDLSLHGLDEKDKIGTIVTALLALTYLTTLHCNIFLFLFLALRYLNYLCERSLTPYTRASRQMASEFFDGIDIASP